MLALNNCKGCSLQTPVFPIDASQCYFFNPSFCVLQISRVVVRDASSLSEVKFHGHHVASNTKLPRQNYHFLLLEHSSLNMLVLDLSTRSRVKSSVSEKGTSFRRFRERFPSRHMTKQFIVFCVMYSQNGKTCAFSPTIITQFTLYFVIVCFNLFRSCNF